jgi:hypothetical protein
MKAFFDALGETRKLGRFFPGGFDFGVEPFDPVVLDLADLVDEYEKPELKDIEEIMLRHAQRHINECKRFELFTTLCNLDKKASKKQRKPLATAMLALDDTSMNPCLVLLVYDLYRQHIIMKTQEYDAIMRSTTDPGLLPLIEKALTEGDLQSLEALEKEGGSALPSLEDYLNEAEVKNEIHEEPMTRLLTLLSLIPGFRAAYHGRGEQEAHN